MFKISFVSDCIFVFVFSFLVFFTPISYYISGKAAAIIISACFSVITLALFCLASKKKYGKTTLKKADEKKYSELKNYLLLADDKEVEKILFEMLEKSESQPISSKNGLFISDGRKVAYKFSARPLGVDEVIEAYKSTPKNTSLAFFSTAFDTEALKFAENLSPRIKLVDFSALYSLLSKYDCIPEIPTDAPPLKKRSLGIIKTAIESFDKKKAKNFAFYGFITLVLSRFAMYKIYYIATGCLFIIYAIILKFFAKPKESPPF